MAEELDTTQGWCPRYDAVADLANWEHSPTAGPNQKELVVGAGPPVDDGLVAATANSTFLRSTWSAVGSMWLPM